MLQRVLAKNNFLKRIWMNSLFDLHVALLESDVSQEVIDDFSLQIKNNLVGMKIQKNETAEKIIASTLKNNFLEILSKAGSIDLLV